MGMEAKGGSLASHVVAIRCLLANSVTVTGTQVANSAPQSPSLPSPAPQLPSPASEAPLGAFAALARNPSTFDREKLAKARACRKALREAQAQAQARDPSPPRRLTKAEPRGPRPLNAKQKDRKLPKARKTPQRKEREPPSNEKKEVGPHIALCSENAVRGFVLEVAHVAMSECRRECKSFSTPKMFE